VLCLAELDALDQKRLCAQQNLERYQACLSRAFNKKVQPHWFQVGDQVFTVRRPIIVPHKTGSKFTSKWNGPDVIQEVYTKGAYRIVGTDWVWIEQIHDKFLKLYYPWCIDICKLVSKSLNCSFIQIKFPCNTLDLQEYKLWTTKQKIFLFFELHMAWSFRVLHVL